MNAAQQLVVASVVASVVVFGACADDPARSGSAIARAVDSRGVPRMIEAYGGPRGTAREHVARLAPMWGVRALPALEERGDVRVRGGTITRLAQVIDGLPIWGGELRVLVRGSGELAVTGGTLVDATVPRTQARFVDDEAGALLRAAAGEAIERAMARKVWYPSGGALVAAWVVDAYTRGPSTDGDAHRTIIAGDDGRVLDRYSLVADAFDYRVFAATTGDKHPLDGPLEDATPHPTGVPDGSYPGYLTGPSLVSVESLAANGDPWLAPNATESSGNNVDAYADFNAPSGFSAGDLRATATAGVFDHAYDTAQGPMISLEQQMASVTSLFYSINWLHDFWYDAGFTETARNAQLVNYGRGGIEGDPMLAEAQDNALGGSRNNANMTTPDDGMPPRMQVFLWRGADDRTLTLAPSGRTPPIGGADFGPDDFDVTAEVVIGDDAAGALGFDGCDPFPTTYPGKIVMVRRGNCTFRRKTLNVQNAGGTGVIIENDTTSASPPHLGDDPSISEDMTIPAVSVTQAEGVLIEQDVAAGTVTATLHRVVAVELDGALDSTLVAHEFGHYLHHRLSLCTNTMCRAISEGWGDFLALMLIARAGDDLRGAFPFSQYATMGYPDDPSYFGIRRAPYSVDPAINALAFRHMADGEELPAGHPIHPSNNNAEVHNAGEIWTQALWEAYVALQEAGSDFAAVRAKMASYVVAGLLLVPPEASPTETRDAIIAAARAASPADEAVMIAAFARRGFGSCAVSPPAHRVDFVGIVESDLVAASPNLGAATVDDGCDEDGVLDTGETAHVSLTVVNRGHAPLANVTLAVTSSLAGVAVLTPPTTVAQLAPGQVLDLVVAVSLAPGVTAALAADLALVVTGDGGCSAVSTFPIAARLNVDDVPTSSATDSFDTATSVWTPWNPMWRHTRESALDGVWHGDAPSLISDSRLSTPPLEASANKPLVVSFAHRHQFEVSGAGTAFDGGVIEYSIEGEGEVWQDVSTVAAPSYNGTVDQHAANKLAERAAYVGENPSYPEMDTVTMSFGTALAGQRFRLRFRIGTDNGVGTAGWDIDDVAFSGIVGTPFSAQVADDGQCEPPVPPDDPILSGGGGCCQTGARGDGALALVVLACALRRRRKH
jgi:hypothetical protein